MDIAFQDGGVWMMPIFGLGVGAIVCGIIGGLMYIRALTYAALACTLLCLLLGLAGYYEGLELLEQALSSVSSRDFEAARERGTQIAWVPLKFAMFFVIPGTAAAIFSWVRSRGKA